MRAYVQEQRIETSDKDLRWVTLQPDGTTLTLNALSSSLFIWEGTLTLPAPRTAGKFRIYVAEFEQHKVVRPGDGQARVTYLDAIEI